MVVLETSLLAGGAIIVILAAAGVVESGTAFAKRLGVSPLVIGLSIVALGTTSPELGVGIVAAARGEPEIALGNVIGSNILNVLLVLGLMATLRPIGVERITLRRDLPLVFAASLVVLALAWDGLLRREEGAILAGGAIVYLIRLYRNAERGWLPPVDEMRFIERVPLPLQIVIAAASIAGLWLGGWMMVEGALRLAVELGLTNRIVALTIVAFGTSVPELATALTAVRRGRTDLAVGDLVGSNLLNLTTVLGITLIVAPLEVAEPFLLVDLPFMSLVAVVLIPLAWKHLRIGRTSGIILLGTYVAYVAFRYLLVLYL